MDKRERSTIFRERVEQAMTRAGLSRSALARETGVDRSTIGQILSGDDARLPNAQLAADAAQALGVSTDWLLGLTERPEQPGDLIDLAMSMTEAGRSVADTQIFDWYREASGYKIRYVPAKLPHVLMTEDVLRWEYAEFLGRTPDQAIASMRERIDWITSGPSDHEIAVPLHEMEAFAEGSGYWQGLDPKIRKQQLDRLANLTEEHYPSLRVFLYDAHHVFSAPVTIFGPLLAVLYVGRFYLAFREGRRVKSLTKHFDWLVREAAIDARQASKHFRTLAARIVI